jgi:recombination protein RecA
MADMRPKAPMSLAEKLKILNKVIDGVNKEAGKKVIGFLSDKEILEKLTFKFIPTPCQELDEAIGGGFPRGHLTIIAGLPDSGKTTYVLETIAMNMKMDPSFIACWVESENSLNKDFICDTFGIDPARFIFIEHESTGAGEKAIDELQVVIASGAVDLVCINSLKALVPSEEFEKTMKEASMAVQARMNSRMVRKFTSIVAENEVAFIVITHLSSAIGQMWGDSLVISGGHAIIHHSHIILDFRKKSIGDNDPITREEGVKIGVTVKRNHCVPDRNPYVKLEYYAIFGYGVEKYLQVLDNALKQGVLIQSGAWIRDLDGEGNVRTQWQGKKKFREYCMENPEYFEELRKRIRNNIVAISDEEIEEIEQEEEKLAEMSGEDKPKRGRKAK